MKNHFIHLFFDIILAKYGQRMYPIHTEHSFRLDSHEIEIPIETPLKMDGFLFRKLRIGKVNFWLKKVYALFYIQPVQSVDLLVTMIMQVTYKHVMVPDQKIWPKFSFSNKVTNFLLSAYFWPRIRIWIFETVLSTGLEKTVISSSKNNFFSKFNTNQFFSWKLNEIISFHQVC